MPVSAPIHTVLDSSPTLFPSNPSFKSFTLYQTTKFYTYPNGNDLHSKAEYSLLYLKLMILTEVAGEEENTAYHHFSFSQKGLFKGKIKPGIVWSRVDNKDCLAVREKRLTVNPFPNKPWFLRV